MSVSAELGAACSPGSRRQTGRAGPGFGIRRASDDCYQLLIGDARRTQALG